MLEETLKSVDLAKCLTEFTPFPSYAMRDKWDAVPEEVKQHYLSKAVEFLGKDWPSLPAMRYMDFYNNGNRNRYETVCFKRRNDLFTLTMAECFEGKGRFLEDIINAVWLICEESTWVVPAHNNHHYRSGKPLNELVNIEEPVYIDLFAAETGSTLSWVYYFLGDEIAKISPLVKRRIELEMDRRILKPYLASDDFHWMGLTNDDPVNNWNPWINSNILVAYFIFGKEDKIPGVEKTIKSIQRFIHFYHEDGGCDEGPGYFNVAGASLFDCLEELDLATKGAINIYDQALIKNMATYIYKVYVGKNYYVNFADAAPRVFPAASLLSRVGAYTHDDNLMGFSSYLLDNNLTNKQYINFNWTLFRTLSNIFMAPKEKKPFEAPKVSWFDGIQLLTVRDSACHEKGIFVAAKGGHNAESHNHNDIGNFVLYHNMVPVLVDAGVETYCKKTFSEQRYEIWSMQSCYHNTPTINGFTQLPGEEHCATNVKYSSTPDAVCLEMDIQKAYPAEAKITQYHRTMNFVHGKSFTVTDHCELTEALAPLSVNFLYYDKPQLQEGSVALNGVRLTYCPKLFDVTVEEIALTDPKMHNDWEKDTLYRLVLTAKTAEKVVDATFTFTTI